MLTSLVIRDFVLIERLDLTPQAGLTVLTGETGAGKSILLDALGAACGARAEARFVRSGASKADITASFSISPISPLLSLIQDQEIELQDDNTLILRRVIQPDGRSKAYINDTPASIGLLKTLGDALLEVHGQFETTGLLDPKTHLTSLDDFAKSDLATVAQAFDVWQAAQEAEESLTQTLAHAAQHEEDLRATLDSLKKLKPEAGELDHLQTLQQTLKHKEKLALALSTALAALQDEAGAASCLETSSRALSKALDLLESPLQKVIEHIDMARDSVAEAESLLEPILSDLDDQQMSLEDVEDRLYELRSAARRYQVSPDELPHLQDKVEAELTALSGSENHLSALAAATQKAQQAYSESCNKLHAVREKAALKLETRIAEELAPLKMEKAKFKVEISPKPAARDGQDSVRFLVSTNVGSAFAPLDKIASGGELARFMLALKAVLADSVAASTMIFDEVDQGVGGAVASAVGLRLKKLATSGGQVLVVTHSPQVAAMAQNHWKIEKRSTGSATTTYVTELTSAQRREEIARMLSGEQITQTARDAADELIKGASLRADSLS